ncbi:MAG: arsenate reductase ArsC [Herminiimonas sp.]|nr:arsenate reductase ArsC [Herminiimonas sp.]
MTTPRYNVLFLCTGNSARSIMAEALITSMSQGRLRGFSAGSRPGGVVNPFAIEQIRKLGYPLKTLRSKSWDEFAPPDAPKMDFIITVCDNAASEACPFWPGHPVSAHWGFEDPAAVAGSDDEKRRAFQKVFNQIQAKVQMLADLPDAMMEMSAVQHALQAIGNAPVNCANN